MLRLLGLNNKMWNVINKYELQQIGDLTRNLLHSQAG